MGTVALISAGLVCAQEKSPDKSVATPYAGFNRAPWNDPNYFPIAVWCQNPDRFADYKAAGINLNVGIHDGPKLVRDLEPYEKAGLPILAEQTDAALQYVKEKPNGIIVGWMQYNEMDGVQSSNKWARHGWNTIEDIKAAWPEATPRSLAEWGKYGPPIAPKQVIAYYAKIRENDPTRPVFLNFTQGPCYEKYKGRGYRTGKSEDYAEYMKGCDIASFDHFPVNDIEHKDITGKLWYLPEGVENLRKWNGDNKPVWNCIECVPASDPSGTPSPDQIKTEVWMSLIAGSRGIVYFCHIFKPTRISAGLLSCPEQLKAVTAVNQLITSLAQVLNSPTVQDGVEVKSSNAEVPISVMVKKFGGVTYVFSVAMRDKETTATFKLKDGGNAAAEVINESRNITINGGLFEDKFKGYEVHLYKIKPSSGE